MLVLSKLQWLLVFSEIIRVIVVIKVNLDVGALHELGELILIGFLLQVVLVLALLFCVHGLLLFLFFWLVELSNDIVSVILVIEVALNVGLVGKLPIWNVIRVIVVVLLLHELISFDNIVSVFFVIIELHKFHSSVSEASLVMLGSGLNKCLGNGDSSKLLG